jgi:hypothetical protein
MKWNLDTLLQLLIANGAEVGEDSEGQIVIYTGYRENADGQLERVSD